MNHSVLIIEDEADILDALTGKLTRQNINVLRAKNGEEGLALALAKRPDLILLDLLMPKLGGMDMLKRLRQDEWGKTVHVIVLTNLSDVANISEALSNKVTEYLVKADWDIDEVAKKINEKLKS